MLDLKLLDQKYCSTTQFLFAISYGINDIFPKASVENEQTDITERRKYHSIIQLTIVLLQFLQLISFYVVQNTGSLFLIPSSCLSKLYMIC